MDRRAFITRTGAAAASVAFSPLPQGRAHAQDRPKRRILFFTKSSGFEHSVIKKAGDAPSHAEGILTELGAKHGFEITHTKDGRVFTPENLARYDAFFFYTTGTLTDPGRDGNPPMTPEGKHAFLDAVRNGKGFIGTHSATDTFHTLPDPPDRSNRYFNHGDKADPYVRMIGAEFIKHGPQQVAKMTAVDTKFPGCESLGAGFEMHEEWYSLKDFSPDLHVILVQETAGMRGEDYQRPPFPATWARMHGRGRVFYTSMGHREDVWTNPTFQSILLGGIAWACRNVDAAIPPNLQSVTPRHAELPPKPA